MKYRYVFYNILSSVIPMLASLVFIPLYLDQIGNLKYALITITLTIITILSLIDFGINKSILIVNNESINSFNFEKVFKTGLILILCLSFIISIIFFYLSNLFAYDFIVKNNLLRKDYNNIVLFIILFIPIFLLIPLFKNILISKLKFEEVNKYDIIVNLSTIIIPFAISKYYTQDISNLIFYTLLPRLFLLIFLYLEFVKIFNFNIKYKEYFEINIAYELLNSGKWIMLIMVLSYITVTTEKILISSYLYLENLTVYTLSFDLASKLMVISSAVSNTIFPYFLNKSNIKYDKFDSFQSEKNFEKLMTLLCITAILFINEFLKYWLNDKYTSEFNYIAEIIIVGVWFNSLSIYMQANMIVNNKSNLILVTQIFNTIIYFIIFYIFLDYFSIFMAALLWSFKSILDTISLLIIEKKLKRKIYNNYLNFILILIALFIVINLK